MKPPYCSCAEATRWLRTFHRAGAYHVTFAWRPDLQRWVLHRADRVPRHSPAVAGWESLPRPDEPFDAVGAARRLLSDVRQAERARGNSSA